MNAWASGFRLPRLRQGRCATYEIPPGVVATRGGGKFFDEEFGVGSEKSTRVPSSNGPSAYRSATVYDWHDPDAIARYSYRRGNDGNSVPGPRQSNDGLRSTTL